MKFKLDENIPADAASVLRAAGHDAVTVATQDLGGARDEVLADVCRAEGRALLTFDIDFANIRAYPPAEGAGVVVFRLSTQQKGHLLEVLRRLVRTFESTSPAGQLWIVDEERIRIRE